jgi:hypothetical protein
MSVLQNQDGWWGEGDDMFSSTANRLPQSTVPAARIISSAHTTSAITLFLIGYTVRR